MGAAFKQIICDANELTQYKARNVATKNRPNPNTTQIAHDANKYPQEGSVYFSSPASRAPIFCDFSPVWGGTHPGR